MYTKIHITFVKYTVITTKQLYEFIHYIIIHLSDLVQLPIICAGHTNYSHLGFSIPEIATC